MNKLLNKLNLRPQERRLVVIVAIVLFVVLNLWLVWPHFGDWGMTEMKRNRSQKTWDMYTSEISRMRAYQFKLRELESAGGSSVVPEEQELDLVRIVDNQARSNRLNVILAAPSRVNTAQTNQFFEEQYQTLHVTSDNDELVNFLVSLTSTNSMIRVKDLNLKVSDTAGTRLDAQMTLVASYQRRTPTRARAGAATASVIPSSAPSTGSKASLASAKTNKAPLTAGAKATNKFSLPARLTNQPAKKR